MMCMVYIYTKFACIHTHTCTNQGGVANDLKSHFYHVFERKKKEEKKGEWKRRKGREKRWGRTKEWEKNRERKKKGEEKWGSKRKVIIREEESPILGSKFVPLSGPVPT